MGMYTMFEARMTLREDTPGYVLEVVEGLVSRAYDFSNGVVPAIDHPFFKTDRGDWMFGCSSAYHEDDYRKRETFDRETRILDVGFDVKNYDREIEKFLAFIEPFVESVDGCRMRHEEAESFTLITFVDRAFVKA